MEKTFPLLAAALAAASVFAAVKPGDNLLVNGTLEADQAEFPPFWSPNARSKPCFKWHPSGGPDGHPYISVHAEKTPDVRLRQFGLDLVKDGIYRLSMMVRTKGFASGSHTGVMLVNGGLWKTTEGILSLPKDTGGKWRRVTHEFKCFSADDGYVVMVHVTNQKGALDFADVKLNAVDSLALEKSGLSKMATCETRPRLVPLFPLLAKIPAEDPRMTFRFFGELEKADEAYEVVARLRVTGEASADPAAGQVSVPLVRGDIKVPLPQGATNGVVTVGVVEKATGKVAFERCYRFNVEDPVSTRKASVAPARRLNNLCAEVLSARIVADVTNRFTFVMSRDGWTYTAVKGRICDGFSVRIDGRDAIWRDTPRCETFRLLDAGEHVLEIAGVEGGSVVVREIAEILNYCPGVNSHVKENPPYDWEFNERYVLPAVTTQLGGSVPKERRAEFLRRGYRWMQNKNLTGGTAELMSSNLSACAGMTQPYMCGVACDEQNYADIVSIDAYANGFWEYDAAKRPARPIYTWAYGKATQGAASLDFLSACANVSGGTGRLLREHYVPTRETEDEARHYFRNVVCATFENYVEMIPESMGSLGLVFGNFNQVPILSIVHHPEVDYKYMLDMQMNYAANDPLFRGLGLIGYWGSYYADDELHRWSFALMRHYVVEGHTNMLSEAYGFQYRPDHIFNGDFRGALTPWRSGGEVRVDSHDAFASRSQCRWGGNGGVGDTFAVLVRGEGEVSSLSQTARGLVPGRKYCLQFATFDVKDVKANRVAPRRFAVSATLSEGAEIDKALSWVHVDERIKGRYEVNNGVARINLHHIVFTAKSSEVVLKLDNAAASPGEELGVNYISLLPYYAR